MNRPALSLASAAAGALLAYWLDPEYGRRRRARAADRLASLTREGRRFADVALRDARNRGGGLAAQALTALAEPRADDAILVERVRSKLGRAVSHPHALEVAARDGVVTLAGPVLSREADALLDCARRVRGVRAVEDRLSRHDSPARIPALQGGLPRHGATWEFAQRSWSPSARVAAAALGAALVARALSRQQPLAALLGLAGVGLLARGTSNLGARRLLGLGAGEGVRVEKTIHIQAPVQRVFAFWREPQNFPRFMRHVVEVRGDADGMTHWRVVGAPGALVEWTACCTGFEDNALIAWETVPGSAVRHAGAVRFEDCGDGSTRVHVRLSYQPPAGAIGHALARLVGVDPKHQLDDDLMRAKAFIETGHAAHDAAAHTARRVRAGGPAPLA